MPLHDGLHNCQAQAGSGGVFARLAPTKAQARTLDVRLRHTRPVVFDHDLCAGTFHPDPHGNDAARRRSEEHTSELQSLMRISYAVFCLKNKKKKAKKTNIHT